MRVVISHFFNEEYLLPWWLKHHVPLFDYGILINHGSTDKSADIIRDLAPHWRLVNSRLTEFDAALTDLEVSNYESELPPSWRIVLNVTEFLMPAKPLAQIESELSDRGLGGCACSGLIVVDEDPLQVPGLDRPLVLQKHFGIEDNLVSDQSEESREKRLKMGLDRHILRNRFYHRHSIGMYGPGRHNSTNPDYHFRNPDMSVFYYAFAPWTDAGIARKTQIKNKIRPADLARGWGTHHTFTPDQWQSHFDRIRPNALDLSTIEAVRSALQLIEQNTERVPERLEIAPKEQQLDYARLLHEEQLHRTDLQRRIARVQNELVGNIGSKELVRILIRRLGNKLSRG